MRFGAVQCGFKPNQVSQNKFVEYQSAWLRLPLSLIASYYSLVHWRGPDSGPAHHYQPTSPEPLPPHQNHTYMLRKRISRWTSRPDVLQQPYCAFSEAFWQFYVETLSRPPSGDYPNVQPVNAKKYTSSSATVALVKGFFTPELPQPSTYQIIAALKSPFTQGDVVKAYYLIRFFQLSDQGYFITNDGHDRSGSPIGLQGSENWENVMCYLDSLLFSMFANLESFEPMLFLLNQHPNPLVAQLLGLLRVYVNLLRLGNLVTTDLTQKICECLCKLGFQEALSHKQQDCAPLFEFLTETLSMPLLTFRVEIQHSGKQDNDDKRYSKERILFVSIPEVEQEAATDEPILLEECLEHYFNNSISVKRELQRRATGDLRGMQKFEQYNPVPEVLETGSLDTKPNLPKYQSASSLSFAKATLAQNQTQNLAQNLTQNLVQVRTRSSTLSIWSINSADSKPREVMLPAWMLLRLLPFYTDDNEVTQANESIAKNSDEFANRRPVVPICLKRYSFSNSTNEANRSKRHIVIPPVIDLPTFVADDDVDKDTTNFKLILESAICHRGTTIKSGHFVSAVRKNTHIEDETLDESQNALWYLYDDLKSTRVTTQTFNEIFDKEWPYMLFYRLVPSSSSGSLNGSISSSRSGGDMSMVNVPKGYRAKYWAEDQLTPIMSPADALQSNFGLQSNMGSEVASNSSKLDVTQRNTLTKMSSTLSNASIPMPDCTPNTEKFVDIRKRYLWYVTDKDKNYYKECASLSKSGSRNMSISITPQFRRNSQWSETSNISGFSLGGPSTEPVSTKDHLDFDKVEERLKKLQVGDNEKQSLPVLDLPKEEHHEKEHRHHLHKIFSHDHDRDHASLAKKHVKKKRAEYKKEKCTVM